MIHVALPVIRLRLTVEVVSSTPSRLPWALVRREHPYLNPNAFPDEYPISLLGGILSGAIGRELPPDIRAALFPRGNVPAHLLLSRTPIRDGWLCPGERWQFELDLWHDARAKVQAVKEACRLAGSKGFGGTALMPDGERGRSHFELLGCELIDAEVGHPILGENPTIHFRTPLVRQYREVDGRAPRMNLDVPDFEELWKSVRMRLQAMQLKDPLAMPRYETGISPEIILRADAPTIGVARHHHSKGHSKGLQAGFVGGFQGSFSLEGPVEPFLPAISIGLVAGLGNHTPLGLGRGVWGY